MKRWGWIVLAVVLGGCTNEKEHLNAEWKKVEKDAVAAGVPLRPGQVVEGLSVSPKENAALALKTALAKTLKPARSGQPILQPAFQPAYGDANKAIADGLVEAFVEGKQPDYGALKRGVAVLDPIVVEAEKALQKPSWDFQRPWADGINMLMPDLARDKALAKWFAAKAMVAAHEGRDREAEQAVADIYRIGYHLRTEPTLIGVLVALATEGIAEKAALDIARIVPANKALLKRLMSLQEAERRPIDWQKVWLNENATMLDSLRYAYGKDAKPGQAIKALRAKVGVARLLTQSQEAWGKPPHDFAKLLGVAQKFEKPIGDLFLPVDPNYQEAFKGEGMFTGLANAYKTIEARHRATRLALAMVAAGPQGGQWTLPSEATQAPWLDPYSGKPMLLRSGNKGFTIYSVGENKIDDGGSQKRDAQNHPKDIVISYPDRHKAEPSKND